MTTTILFQECEMCGVPVKRARDVTCSRLCCTRKAQATKRERIKKTGGVAKEIAALHELAQREGWR